jgi:hypothetical protein
VAQAKKQKDGVTVQVLKNLGAPIELAEVTQSVRAEHRLVQADESRPPVETTVYRTFWQAQREDGEVKRKRTHLRLTNNALASIESFFGSMEAFQHTLEVRQNEALRAAVCASQGYDPNDINELEMVGAMLLDDQMVAYAAALQVALALANGVDPTQALALWADTQEALKEQSAEANTAVSELLEDSAEERRQMAALSQEERDELRRMDEWAKAELAKLRPKERADLVKAFRSTPGSSGSASGSASDETPTSSGS